MAIFVLPGGQKGPATHGGKDIALVVGPHLLGGDIVGVHPLGSTVDGQRGEIGILGVLVDIVFVQDVDELGEGRGDIDASIVFNALDSLS